VCNIAGLAEAALRLLPIDRWSAPQAPAKVVKGVGAPLAELG